MYKGYIFDFDGTLADTLPVCFEAFRRTLRKFTGREYTDRDIRSHLGPAEAGVLRNLVPYRAAEALADYLAEYELAQSVRPALFPGIDLLLQQLRAQQAYLAIVSGKGPGSMAISLRHAGIGPYFDLVETGTDAGATKPAAIAKVLQTWGLSCQAVAYVGDAPSDLNAAKAAGVAAIAAVWAASADVAAMAALQPDWLFCSVAEFSAWLRAAANRPPE